MYTVTHLRVLVLDENVHALPQVDRLLRREMYANFRRRARGNCHLRVGEVQSERTAGVHRELLNVG